MSRLEGQLSVAALDIIFLGHIAIVKFYNTMIFYDAREYSKCLAYVVTKILTKLIKKNNFRLQLWGVGGDTDNSSIKPPKWGEDDTGVL